MHVGLCPWVGIGQVAMVSGAIVSVTIVSAARVRVAIVSGATVCGYGCTLSRFASTRSSIAPIALSSSVFSSCTWYTHI